MMISNNWVLLFLYGGTATDCPCLALVNYVLLHMYVCMVNAVHVRKVLVVVVDVVHVLRVKLRLVRQFLQEGSVVTDYNAPGCPRLTSIDHTHSCVFFLLTACKGWSSLSVILRGLQFYLSRLLSIHRIEPWPLCFLKLLLKCSSAPLLSLESVSGIYLSCIVQSFRWPHQSRYTYPPPNL